MFCADSGTTLLARSVAHHVLIMNEIQDSFLFSTQVWPTFIKTCTVLATLAGAYLLYELGEIVIVLFFAVVLASAMRPFVTWLTRHRVPQVVAILSLYLVFFTLLIGLLSLAIPPLIGLTVDFLAEGLLVEQINQLLPRLILFGERQFQVQIPNYQIPDYLVALATDAAGNTARNQALPVAQGTLLVLGQIALIFVTGFYWLAAHREAQQLLLRVAPLNRRADIELLWNDVETTLGRYIRGQLILMIVIGVISYVGLLLLGIEHALALAVIAGLTEAIPVVGPILGAIPAVIVGLTISPLRALFVILLYVVIQQLEANVLVPKIMEDNVGLNPLVVIVVLVAGATLGGVVGAILAIPLAGAVQVFIQRLLIQPAIEEARVEAEQNHKVDRKNG